MNLRHCIARLLAIALACFPMVTSASFLFTGEGRYARLVEEVSYRFEEGEVLGIGQVIALETGWMSQATEPFQGRAGRVTLWARFDMPAPPHGEAALIAIAPWEVADFHVVRAGRVVDHERTGTLVPWQERRTRVTGGSAVVVAGLVAVDVPPAPRTTVYVRLQSEQRLTTIEALRFTLLETTRVLDAERHDRIFQGMFYGVMLFLVVYNLGLLVTTREPSYLYYVVMEAGFSIGWAVVYGMAFEFLWPGHPRWDYYALWIASELGGYGMSQFLRHYLDTPGHYPRIDRLLVWGARLSLAGIPLIFLPFTFEVLSRVLIYMAPLSSVAILAVLVHTLRSRHPLAPNLLLAMSFLCAGLVIYFGIDIGIIPRIDATVHAPQIGSAMAGIILSLGLNIRLQRMRAELAERKIVHEREKRELIEEQNRLLEGKVVERTAQLTVAQEKSDALLANILPQAIIDELRASGATEPRRHEEASILFTDFSGFTQAVSTMPPRRLVQELNEIFRGFDDIVAAHGLEKIKTIGDAYMAAGGLPVSAADHAVRCVRAGLALTRFIENRNLTAAMKWGLRVGVHSGAVVAGVVGKNKYAYDVWGDTVNIASRLESTGEVNRVNISAYTYELVRDHFACEYRGKVAAKGKGEIDMYFVVSERENPLKVLSPIPS